MITTLTRVTAIHQYSRNETSMHLGKFINVLRLRWLLHLKYKFHATCVTRHPHPVIQAWVKVVVIIHNLQSHVQASVSRVQTSVSRVQASVSRVQASVSRVQANVSRVQASISRHSDQVLSSTRLLDLHTSQNSC